MILASPIGWQQRIMNASRCSTARAKSMCRGAGCVACCPTKRTMIIGRALGWQALPARLPVSPTGGRLGAPRVRLEPGAYQPEAGRPSARTKDELRYRHVLWADLQACCKSARAGPAGSLTEADSSWQVRIGGDVDGSLLESRQKNRQRRLANAQRPLAACHQGTGWSGTGGSFPDTLPR